MIVTATHETIHTFHVMGDVSTVSMTGYYVENFGKARKVPLITVTAKLLWAR
jgi:hypothetical protein